ncbi:MAG: FAD-binding oxidoreductase [Chloroflexota bacterium]
MSVKERLAEILGQDNVLASPEVMAPYGRDHSTEAPGQFTCVARPRTVSQTQKVIELANELKFAVVPQTSRVHFHGGAVPKEGGVVLDLAGMDRIVEIVSGSMVAHLQVGVTWEQFCTELEARGYTPIIPLLPHVSRSVIMDYLEREPPVMQNHEVAEPLLSMQVVWGNGELFVTGSASVASFRSGQCLADGVLPTGPGPMSYDTFLYGAQGTMGVVTWGVVEIEEKPTLSKAFFIPASSLEQLVEPAYQILRAGICHECLILNDTNLAAILATSPEQFQRLRALLPAWTAVVVQRALRRRPEEKLAYQADCLRQMMGASFRGLDLWETLPGVAAAEKVLPEMLRKPWPRERPYWKHAYRGGCEDLQFMTTLERLGWYLPEVNAVAAEYQYASADIGVYVQPVQDGHACQLQFSFYYDPEDAAEKALIRELRRQATAAVMARGAYITRPYPVVADLVYQKYGEYAALLRRFKKHFDPSGILNPGNLCF